MHDRHDTGNGEPPVRHGIDGGAYDNIMHVALGRPAPFLMCLCGWETTHGAAESWGEAGDMLDEHLAAHSNVNREAKDG